MSRILVAEDDPTTQALIYNAITEMGHEVFISPNGQHAYEAMHASNNFDILITDASMPKMDGRQLVTTLRGTTAFRDLPIIIISGVVSFREIQDLLDLGASYFQPKPITIAELKENIERCTI